MSYSTTYGSPLMCFWLWIQQPSMDCYPWTPDPGWLTGLSACHFSGLTLSSSWVSSHWLAACPVSDDVIKEWNPNSSLPTLPSRLSHLSWLPWSKARYGISRKSRWSQRRPCQWAEVWGVSRKWKSNCTGSWWGRGSVASTVKFPAWKRSTNESNSLLLLSAACS